MPPISEVIERREFRGTTLIGWTDKVGIFVEGKKYPCYGNLVYLAWTDVADLIESQ